MMHYDDWEPVLLLLTTLDDNEQILLFKIFLKFIIADNCHVHGWKFSGLFLNSAF